MWVFVLFPQFILNILRDIGILRHRLKKTLVNGRLLHLYELTNRPQKEGVSLDDFRDNDIWDNFDDETLNNWIKRWTYYKENGEIEFYKEYYPVFYEEMYTPFMRDFELYKAKDPNCQFPEFWFWYSSNYLGEELL